MSKYKRVTRMSPRNNLGKIKDGAYVANLDELNSVGTLCMWMVKT